MRVLDLFGGRRRLADYGLRWRGLCSRRSRRIEALAKRHVVTGGDRAFRGLAVSDGYAMRANPAFRPLEDGALGIDRAVKLRGCKQEIASQLNLPFLTQR
jgi:hypothetical protein